jgi:YD repeat-containing protein
MYPNHLKSIALLCLLQSVSPATVHEISYQDRQISLIQNMDMTLYTGLPGQVMPLREPTAEENTALKNALLSWESDITHENFQPLIDFAAQNPTSPWTPSVLSNLGRLTYDRGMFSETLEYLETAWNQAKTTSGPLSGAIAAQYTGILARVGRMEDLERVINETSAITLADSSRVMVEQAKEALWIMENQPEGAFSCGPYALKKLHELKTNGEQNFDVITKDRATKTGFNLKSLEEISASQLGMPLQAVRRTPGTPLVFPCVAHWKVDHYGAITALENGFYKLDDVTFQNSTWMTPAVLDQESSGLYLIPAGELPQGYIAATEEEKITTFGKGVATGSDTSCTTAQDAKCGGSASACKGMATYSFHTFLASLSITDIPVWQESPVGPSVNFQVTYNQQEAQDATFTSFANTSPQWVNNWTSYLVDNPANGAADIKIYLPGGGSELHSGYNSTSTSFAKNAKSETTLKRLSNGVYQRAHSDGSIEIYARALGTTNPRRIFLSQIKDPQGNTVTLNYDATLTTRLNSITDAAGRSMTLSYEDGSNAYLITKATDASGRSALFSYTTLGGVRRLTSITDVIGMISSFTYDGGSKILTLENPYGTTRFTSGSAVSGSAVSRWIEATDPEGSRERLEYNNNTVAGGPTAASGNAEKPTSVDNFTSGYVQYRNTYFWDKKTMHHNGADYSKAVVTNWNHSSITSVATGVPNSVKKPFENRVWFRYPGQTPGNTVFAGNSNQPAAIVRKINATNNQEVRFEYNSLGNITKRTDALGRETLVEYAGNGMDVTAVKQKTAGGTYDTLQTLVYGATPRLPSSITDAAGQTTNVTYNSRGQVLTVTNPLAETTTIEYEETSGANGYWDVKKIFGPVSGNQTVLTYDNKNRVATVTGPDGLTVSYEYDGFDRVVKTTYPDGTFEQTTYDRLDVHGTKDRDNKWSYTWYNHLRQPILTADPLGQKTQMEWCKCGKLQRLIDPKGNHTKWAYDIQGRNISKTYADGRTETFGFDPATSRPTTITDPKGQVKTLSYFSDDSIASVSYSNTTIATPGVSYTYDAKYPRPLTVTDGIGATSFSYYSVGVTGAGKIAGENGPLSGDIDKIAYTYDIVGRLKKTNIGPLGTENTEEATIDSLGRITALQNNLGTFGMAYIGQTNRPDSVSYPNGQKTTFDYFGSTGDLRLKTIHNLKVGTNNTSTLSRFDYTYSPSGEILTWQRQFGDGTTVLPSSTYSFGYDKTEQLTSATLKADVLGTVLKKFSYSYDPMGNRTSSQVGNTITGYTSNAANQTTSTSGSGKLHVAGNLDEPSIVKINGIPAGGQTSKFEAFVPVTPGANTLTIEAEDYSPNKNTSTKSWSVDVTGGIARTITHDSNGNTLDDGIRTYQWDAENRIAKITKGSDYWEFAYDGASRRVLEKKNGTATRRWTWLGTKIAQELNAAGNSVLKNFFSNGERRALLLHPRPSWLIEGDDRQQRSCSSEKRFRPLRCRHQNRG